MQINLEKHVKNRIWIGELISFTIWLSLCLIRMGIDFVESALKSAGEIETVVGAGLVRKLMAATTRLD